MDKMKIVIVIFCIASVDLFSGTFYVTGFEESIESDSSTIICSGNKTISIVNMTVKQTTTSCSAYEQCRLTDEQMDIIKENCNDEISCSITSLVPNSCLLDDYGHLNISYSCKENVDRSCNFESGMCGWTVKGPDRYIWQIGKGKTPTLTTGPNRDHTTSTSYGHYVYTESKGDIRLDDESDLLSESIVPSPKQCLSFWYHMYGRSINKLVVYQMNSNYNIELWNVSNNQGNKWYFQSLTLRDIGPYQIKFKAIRGKWRTSDIAIDDIDITNNDCNAFHLQIDCNFEADICKWSKDNSNIYEWIVLSGSTPSNDTGPEVDHTLGSLAGHYIYLEASSKDIGTKSNLTSTTVYPNGDACFTFWYYLYGEGMGTLNVYLESEEILTTAWSISGNRNKRWWFTSFDISKSKPYRVIFEGIRGNTSKSDIALDDIVLLPGSCGDSVLNCNFEAENCLWKTNIQSNYTWTIISGKTPSGETGPIADHTSGSLKGHYAYFEGSKRTQGDESNFTSMTVHPHGDACFTFWYHMFGSGMGALNVYLVMENTTRKLWAQSGNQQNVWRFGFLDINATEPYTMTFEGIRGRTATSDIAVDDISLLSIPCNERGFVLDCNFETDKCNWSSDLTTSYIWATAARKTNSWYTGPSNDHTTASSNGHYKYLEGSHIPNGTKSELTSTTVNLNGTICFTFWYHMYGKGMGTLNVYIQSGNTTTKYWSQSGDQGRNWKFANFDILSLEPYNIIFEGIRGVNYTSDIAIDDISLLQSSCSGSFNYSQTCLNKATSISLSECSKYYLQLNNLVFDREFDNCSAEYQDAQGLIKTQCDDVDISDVCTFNLSEVIKKEPKCFQSKRLLVEYTCEERVPTILSDDSQKTTVPLDTGLVVGMVVAIVLLVCVFVLIICVVRRQVLRRKPKEKQKTGLDKSGNEGNESISLPSVTADTNNQNFENIGTNDNQCDMQMNENTSFIKGLKQKTDPIKFSKGLDHYETGFAGSESYELHNLRSSVENKQNLKTGQDDIYCQSEEGTYDISGCNRHKQADGNIYSHTVDDVYDSTTRKRNDDDQEDKYDHFIGQKTEDLYDISMHS